MEIKREYYNGGSIFGNPEDLMSEEETGILPDDGLPPIREGYGYWLRFNYLRKPKTSKFVGVYRGINENGEIVFDGNQGSMRFNPRVIAGFLETGVLEIAPTGKTMRKLAKNTDRVREEFR